MHAKPKPKPKPKVKEPKVKEPKVIKPKVTKQKVIKPKPKKPTAPMKSDGTKGKNSDVVELKESTAVEPTDSDAIEQARKALADLEDKSAAAYADTRTPGAPSKIQNTKGTSAKRPAPEVDLDTQESDTYTVDGTDVERTVQKKRKGATEARQAIQAMRSIPQMGLRNNEEENPVTDHQMSSKISKEVQGGQEGVIPKDTAAEVTIGVEDSDIEMQGQHSGLFRLKVFQLTYICFHRYTDTGGCGKWGKQRQGPCGLWIKTTTHRAERNCKAMSSCSKIIVIILTN